MERNVRVLIDGREVYGFPGQTILELCQDCGVEIPYLCYDPHLSVHGGCSVCLVEVKGAKTLVRACSNKISNGMEIYTDTEKARLARKTALAKNGYHSADDERFGLFPCGQRNLYTY